jgi:hypothetical protein
MAEGHPSVAETYKRSLSTKWMNMPIVGFADDPTYVGKDAKYPPFGH